MDEVSWMKVHTRAEVEAMSEGAKVEIILALEARLCALEPRVRELETRLGLNRRNSSKPPSSDGPAKPVVKSLREKSGRPPGGQPGHEGTTLRQVATPDRVERHVPHRCACGCVLTGQPVTRVERYQVFDLPEPRMAVTEHQVHVTICPACEAECKGALPPEVSAAPVQYGPRVRALVVYLRVYQLLPYERVRALCGDVFGLPVSKATIEAAEVEADGHLQPFVEEVAAQLRAAPVAHVDETGFRVEGRTRWLHVVATPALTLYHVDDKRGQQASTCWIPSAEVERVAPSPIAGVELSMEALSQLTDSADARQKLASLVTNYRQWISEQRAAIPSGPSKRAQTGKELLDRAEVAAKRIEAGIQLLNDPMALDAFKIANRTMATAARRRFGVMQGKDPAAVSAPSWRPFQLAFILIWTALHRPRTLTARL